MDLILLSAGSTHSLRRRAPRRLWKRNADGPLSAGPLSWVVTRPYSTAQHKVPVTVQQTLLGKNAGRLYAIETVMVVTERIEQYEPAQLLW